MRFNESARYRIGAHQIPPVMFDGSKLFFAYNSKDALWSVSVCMKFQVQCDGIGRIVAEVIEAVKELEDKLEEVVTRSESEHRVQGGHRASTSREVEKVAVTVLGKTAVCGSGELSG